MEPGRFLSVHIFDKAIQQRRASGDAMAAMGKWDKEDKFIRLTCEVGLICLGAPKDGMWFV